MRKIGKFGYSTLIALCGLDIALAGDFGHRIAEYIMPNPYSEQKVSAKDEVLLARLIFGEARGSSRELKIAVAQTALNRTKNKKCSLEGVILQPYQFSCFNKNDPNYNKVWNPEKYEIKAWKECLELAKEILDNKYQDLSQGANHYHTDKVNPNWAKDRKPLFKVGNTLFYRIN